jgi:integrase
LPNIRFHDLRHTCAPLLLTKGVHPKIVSEMLGHSSVSITFDIYSRVIPGLGEAAAKAMEDIVSP